jgi:hypothetical protein
MSGRMNNLKGSPLRREKPLKEGHETPRKDVKRARQANR